MPKSNPLTREQCAEMFKYLEYTKQGKELIQHQLKAIQQRHEKRMRIKRNSDKYRKLAITKPDEKLDRFKAEIFYLYMQPKSSSKKIREAMKNVQDFDLVDKSARTFDAILNGWGYPLNQDAHSLFIADMRQLLLNCFDQEDNVETENQDDLDAEYELYDSHEILCVGENDRGGYIEAATSTEGTDIAYQAYQNLGSLATTPILGSTVVSRTGYHSVKMPIRLSSSPGATSTKIASAKTPTPFANDYEHESLPETPYEFENTPFTKPPRDSGYESRQVSIVYTRGSGEIASRQVRGSSAQSRPERLSQSHYGRVILRPNLGMGIVPVPNPTVVLTNSTLLKICCNGIHNSGRVITDKNFVCPCCGLAYVHSVGLHVQDMAPADLGAHLFDTLDINRRDNVGNTVLHYAGIVGPTNDVLLQLNKPGIDFAALNTSEQTWLHSLDATRLGHDLLNILDNSNSKGLLDHRDVYGVTILMGLLDTPLKQDVCRKLTEIFMPCHFVIRDSLGRTASTILLDTYRRYPLTLNESESEVLQTISIFQDYANIFDIGPALLHNDNPDQRRIEVIRGAALMDVDGSNTLQCLAYWPPEHTAADESLRYSQIQMAVDFHKADLNNFDNSGNTPIITHIKSVEPNRDDSPTAKIIDFLINRGAHPEFRDRDGKTALYCACVGGLVGCVDVLLKHGARFNVRATPRKNLMFEGDAQRGMSLLQATHAAHETAHEQYMQAESDVSDSLPARFCKVIYLLASKGAKLDPSIIDEWGL